MAMVVQRERERFFVIVFFAKKVKENIGSFNFFFFFLCLQNLENNYFFNLNNEVEFSIRQPRRHFLEQIDCKLKITRTKLTTTKM